ncbi:conserved domain protein [Anaplasma phagocytophilum str. HZ]|uniref:Conserved domain protein n=3 Tax=Anaplasma phagocytophilum TaxID=948 RepID=Q2GKG3_ANAPZ|nr:conserved domain protein [Anaplasma phagocytophilum str. HZ]
MILNKVFIFMGKLTKIFKKKNKISFPAEVDAGSPVNEIPQSNDSAEASLTKVSQLFTNSPEEVAGYSTPSTNEAAQGATSDIEGGIENAPSKTSKKDDGKHGSSLGKRFISLIQSVERKVGKAFSTKPKKKDPEKERSKVYLEEVCSDTDSILTLSTYASYESLSKELDFQNFLDETSSERDSTRALAASSSSESMVSNPETVNSKYVPNVFFAKGAPKHLSKQELDAICEDITAHSSSSVNLSEATEPHYAVPRDVSLSASKHDGEESNSSNKQSNAPKKSNLFKKIKFLGPLVQFIKNGTVMPKSPQNDTPTQSSSTSSEPLYAEPLNYAYHPIPFKRHNSWASLSTIPEEVEEVSDAESISQNSRASSGPLYATPSTESKPTFYVSSSTEQSPTPPMQSPTPSSSSSEPLYYEPLNYAYHPIPFKTNTAHKSVSPVASPTQSSSGSSNSLYDTPSSKSKSTFYVSMPTEQSPTPTIQSPAQSSSGSSNSLYDTPASKSKSTFYVSMPTEQSPTPTIQSPAQSSSGSSNSLYDTPASKSKSIFYVGSTTAQNPTPTIQSPTQSSSMLTNKPTTHPEPKSLKNSGSVTGSVKVKTAAFESQAQSNSEIENKPAVLPNALAKVGTLQKSASAIGSSTQSSSSTSEALYATPFKPKLSAESPKTQNSTSSIESSAHNSSAIESSNYATQPKVIGAIKKPASAVGSSAQSSSTFESKPTTSIELKSSNNTGSGTNSVKVKAAAFESQTQSNKVGALQKSASTSGSFARSLSMFESKSTTYNEPKSSNNTGSETNSVKVKAAAFESQAQSNKVGTLQKSASTSGSFARSLSMFESKSTTYNEPKSSNNTGSETNSVKVKAAAFESQAQSNKVGTLQKSASTSGSFARSLSMFESKSTTYNEPKSLKYTGSETNSVKVKAAAFESQAQSNSEIKSKSVAPPKPKRGILLSDSIQHSAQGNLSVANSVEGVASSNTQEEHGTQKKELHNVLKKFSNPSQLSTLEAMFAKAGSSSSKPVNAAATGYGSSKASTSFASSNNASVKEGQAFAQTDASTSGNTRKSFVQALQQERQMPHKTKSVHELAKQLEEGGVLTQVLASRANASRARF